VILTYVDASVLIGTVRGQGELPTRALAVLDDPERAFAASIFLTLEKPNRTIHRARAVKVVSLYPEIP
jgi:hypothetical protein